MLHPWLLYELLSYLTKPELNKICTISSTVFVSSKQIIEEDEILTNHRKIPKSYKDAIDMRTPVMPCFFRYLAYLTISFPTDSVFDTNDFESLEHLRTLFLYVHYGGLITVNLTKISNFVINGCNTYVKIDNLVVSNEITLSGLRFEEPYPKIVTTDLRLMNIEGPLYLNEGNPPMKLYMLNCSKVHVPQKLVDRLISYKRLVYLDEEEDDRN